MFHFVDADPHEALELAREAAGDLDVRIGGGPSVIRDFLGAGLIDMLTSCRCRSCSDMGSACGTASMGVEERYDIEAVSSPSGVTHLTFDRR